MCLLFVFFMLLYILLWMRVCFCCVRFSFSVFSQEIGWEERLRSDILCVGWDVKPELSQSINTAWLTLRMADVHWLSGCICSSCVFGCNKPVIYLVQVITRNSPTVTYSCVHGANI